MGIHILTLAGPAIALLFSVLFAGIWARWRTLHYLRWLSAAFLLFSVALFSQILIIPRIHGVNTVISCVLYLAATLAFVEGNLSRLGLKLNLPLSAGVSVFIVACTAYFYYGISWPHGRICVMNFGMAILLLMMALKMRGSVHKLLDRVLCWSIILFALQFFPRTVFTMGKLGGLGQELRESDRAYILQSPFWIWMNLSFLLFTVLIGLMLVAVIVSDIADALHQKAITDPLTGLLNRRGLEEFVEGRSAKAGDRLQSLILFDIDDFRSINDVYGHHGGDVVLEQIGSLLRKHVRASSNKAVRLGGEEFVVILRNLDRWDAYEIAERLRHAIAYTRFGEGNLSYRPVTASFGVIELENGESLKQALLRADELLYVAKRAGKNRAVAQEV